MVPILKNSQGQCPRTGIFLLLQILFFDFSIKAQTLLQTINLKSLQAKAQLKKSVSANTTPLQLHHYSLLIAAHLRSPIHFYTTKIHPTMCHLISIV